MVRRIAYLRGDHTTLVATTVEVRPTIHYTLDSEGTLIAVEYDARYTEGEAIQAVHDHFMEQLNTK